MNQVPKTSEPTSDSTPRLTIEEQLENLNRETVEHGQAIIEENRQRAHGNLNEAVEQAEITVSHEGLDEDLDKLFNVQQGKGLMQMLAVQMQMMRSMERMQQTLLAVAAKLPEDPLKMVGTPGQACNKVS
jgi:hypothetical protein